MKLDFIEKSKSVIANKAKNLQALLLLLEINFDNNSDANSLFWLIDNEEKKINNVENLRD